MLGRRRVVSPDARNSDRRQERTPRGEWHPVLQAGPRATAPTPSSCPCPNLPRRGTTLPPVPCEEEDRGERGAGGAKASRPGKRVATIRLLDHSPKGTRRCASSLLLLVLLRKVVVAFVVLVGLPGSLVLAPPSQRFDPNSVVEIRSWGGERTYRGGWQPPPANFVEMSDQDFQNVNSKNCEKRKTRHKFRRRGIEAAGTPDQERSRA